METIVHFFREIPLKSMEWGVAVSIVGTAFSYLIGWNDTIETLLIVMGIDYMTGITAAYLNPGLKLDSRKGMKGFHESIRKQQRQSGLYLQRRQIHPETALCADG